MLAYVGDQSEAIVQATETYSRTARSGKYVLKQNIPVWAAYNSLLTSTNMTKHELFLDALHAFSLLNSPVHEWKALLTSFMQIHKLNVLTRGPDITRHMCVWLDMGLYNRVLKVTCLYPELYEDKWIASPGQFHIVMCALGCLGQTVDRSGLDNAWVDAAICSNDTVMQIINCSHHNRARLHAIYSGCRL